MRNARAECTWPCGQCGATAACLPANGSACAISLEDNNGKDWHYGVRAEPMVSAPRMSLRAMPRGQGAQRGRYAIDRKTKYAPRHSHAWQMRRIAAKRPGHAARCGARDAMSGRFGDKRDD
jgi:hypothetical protein